MLDRFQAAAEAVGTTIKRFSSLEGTGEYLRELAGDGIICRSHLSPEIRTACSGLTFAPPDRASEARLCVSAARAAIADTGSLLLEVTDPADRGATALPLVHAVYLFASAIVPTLADLTELLEQALAAPGHAYLSITTGPSRTADIERVLTIGVHGPKELHVLLIEGV